MRGRLLHEREGENRQRQTILQLRAVVENPRTVEKEEGQNDRTPLALLQPGWQSLQLVVQVATEHQVHVKHHEVRCLDVADPQIAQAIDGEVGWIHGIHKCRYALGKMDSAQLIHRLLLRVIGRSDDEDVATLPTREDLGKHEQSRRSDSERRGMSTIRQLPPWPRREHPEKDSELRWQEKDKDTRIVGDKVINLLIPNEHANLTIPLFVPNRSLPHAAFADTLGGAFYTQIDIVVILQ